MVMFMRPANADAAPLPPTPPLTRVVLAVTVVAILVLGVYPNWFQQVASKGAPRRESAGMIGLSPTAAAEQHGQ